MQIDANDQEVIKKLLSLLETAGGVLIGLGIAEKKLPLISFGVGIAMVIVLLSNTALGNETSVSRCQDDRGNQCTCEYNNRTRKIAITCGNKTVYQGKQDNRQKRAQKNNQGVSILNINNKTLVTRGIR